MNHDSDEWEIKERLEMDGDKRKDKGALQAPLLSVGGTPSCWASHVLTAPDTFPIKGAQSTHPPLTALPHPPLPLFFFSVLFLFSFFLYKLFGVLQMRYGHSRQLVRARATYSP